MLIPVFSFPFPAWKMDAMHSGRPEPLEERPSRQTVDGLNPELRSEKYSLLSTEGKLLGPALSRIRSGRNCRERGGISPGKSPPTSYWEAQGGCWIWEVSVTPSNPRSAAPGGVFLGAGGFSVPRIAGG